MDEKSTLHYTFGLKTKIPGSREFCKIQICLPARNEKMARKKLEHVFGPLLVEKLIKEYSERYPVN